ncbi:MAG: insulinase family protein [Spirochaetia bacterium]|nr:insulinase family protein [Spirochaetia bacterium]
MKKLLIILLLPILPLIFSKINYSDNGKRPWEKYLKNETLKLEIPDMQFFTLKNGIKVYFAENTMLPRTFLKLYIEGGEFEESADKTGLTSLWGDLVVYSGSQEYPREKLAEYLEKRASSFSFSSGLERASFSVSSLSHFFKDDLNIFLSILNAPRFFEEDFSLLKKKTLKGIEKRKENPGGMAYIGSSLKLWENTTRGAITTKKTIESIKNEDFLAWQKKMNSAERMTILLAGDYKKEQIENLLNETIGSLPFKNENLPNNTPLDKPPKNIQFKTFHIVKDIPQTTVLLTAKGINHASDDYYALKIYDFILGGSSFNSMLTREIRTKKGWAYSVYSHYSSGLRYGTIKIFAQTGNQNVFDLLKTVDSILSKPSDFIDENNLSDALQSLRNKFIFLYETPEDLVSTQLSLMWDGLKPDYLKNFISNLEKTNVNDLLSIAKKHYKSDDFFLIVVGPENLFSNQDAMKDIPWLKSIEKLEIPE